MIRQRRDSDLARLATLLEQTRSIDAYPPHWPGAAADLVASVADLGAWVVEDGDGGLAGHVCLHEWTGRSAMAVAMEWTGTPADRLCVVSRLFTDPRRRRRGLGQRLLAQATAEAHALGRRPILDVWDRLPNAIALYEAAGWHRAGAAVIEFRSGCTDLCVHDGSGINSLVYVGPAPR